jgi:hypothetical protein
MSSETPQDSPGLDEKQLCISCLAPNDPSAHFCAKCRAPLSSYASTGPVEHLFAEGTVYRQAAQRPRKFIVVLGVWLIFCPMILICLSIVGMVQEGSLALRIFISLISFAFIAICALMIWSSTRNYFSWRKSIEKGDLGMPS